MPLETAFYAFGDFDSEAKELNVALSKVRERFGVPGSRIINVETVAATTFLGFRLKVGGLRVWYESGVELSQAELK